MRLLLLLLCLLEVLLITYFINFAGPYLSPVIFLLTSAGIGYLYLKIKSGNQEITTNTNSRLLRILPVVLFLVATVALVFKVRSINHANPIAINDTSHSDIIPLIMHLVNRFVNGVFPYSPVPFSGYEIFPNYLPFTWMPYSIAEVLHFDYRWIPALFFWICATVFFIRSWKKDRYNNILATLLIPVWPLIIWHFMVGEEPTMVANTVECLAAAYYLFLAMSLGSRNIWLIGIALSICLLSRYGIVLWLPAGIAAFWMARERKHILTVAFVCLLFFTAFYWLPFLRHDLNIFKNGYDYYTASTLGEWMNARGNNFWHLGNGLGFTKFAFKFFPDMPVEDLMNGYRKFHLVLVLITVLSLVIFYAKNKTKYHLQTFLLFSFKIYLAVFYSFCQMPYKYLFLVPVIVSSVLLSDVYKKSKQPIVN